MEKEHSYYQKELKGNTHHGTLIFKGTLIKGILILSKWNTHKT